MTAWFPVFLLSLAGLLTVARLYIAWLNTAHQLQFPPHDGSEPSEMVSILVPARNEQTQMESLVAHIQKFESITWELIIYDDDSTDDTYDLASRAIAQDERCRVIKGERLPAGWLGKNHACHQLSLAAKGRYLLFLDADVRLEPSALAAALAVIKRKNLSLLSVFPKQQMLTLGEQLIVPFMHQVLLSWLPLRTIYACNSAQFAAANGQFMLFEASHYLSHAWHKQLKSTLIEDVGIMRSLKQGGARGMTLLAANGAVSCRMYNDFDSAVQGFSKNIVKGFGRVSTVLLYSLFTFWVWIPLLFFYPEETFLLFLCLWLSRVLVSRAAGESVFKNGLLHVFQVLAWQYLLVIAVKKYVTKELKWKDRIVS